MKLQTTFGIIPKLKGKGNAAKAVIDMLVRMRKEVDHEIPKVPPEIDQLIIIDRECDLITPMCTQLTYEGLIDEVFGISSGFLDVEPEIIGVTANPAPNAAAPPKKSKIALNSNDKVYANLRDLNFSTVGPLLNKKAKEI